MDVSVVIASYNHAPYLAECIRSALEQTNAPAEVVVVDDGSTDGSREVIESFGSAVRPFFQANQGTYATLNAGITLARCGWIAVHNSDDVWQPGKLEAQVRIAQHDARIGLVHTGVEYIDAHGDLLHDVPGADLRSFTAPETYEALPMVLRTNPVVISSVLVSKVTWESCGKFDTRYLGMGDWEFCIRASQHTRFGFASDPLTRVRKHGASAGMDASRLPPDWNARDWRMMLDATLPAAAKALFAKACLREVSRGDAAVSLASLGTLQMRDGRSGDARRSLRLALRLAPLRIRSYVRYLQTLTRAQAR